MILIEDFDGSIVKYTDEQSCKDKFFIRGFYKKKSWWIGGKLHKMDGPALVDASSWGGIGYRQWFMNGISHRLDGPAYEMSYHYKEWRVNGERINTISNLIFYLTTANRSRIP